MEGASQLSKLSEYRQISNMFDVNPASIKLTLENPALKVELPSNYYIDRALERLMLTKEEFITLKNTPTESLTQQQISQLKLVREAVPTLTVESPLQKVFPVGDIDKYLSGQYISPSGFIAREADLVGVKHYDDMVEALRLDYFNGQGVRSAFPEGGNSYGMIRYKSTDAYKAETPFNKEFGGAFDSPPPFGGSGFTTSRDSRIIPEYSIPRQQRETPAILNGAELIKVEDGIEKVVGTYSEKFEKFIPER